MLNTLVASLLLAVNATFAPPMPHEISLAGNFGEPRPNHFHGGLDIRTEGVEGKRVMSIGDGYVSRLTVGLYGFGNAVYVTHPEGYTSVYCHLQRFSPRLEQMLKRWQYEHEQWEADISLSASDYPVAQGQLIAFSGNTGHSFGPHLHLEVHDTRSWDMLDPLEFLGAYVNDTVPPQVHGVMMYQFSGPIPQRSAVSPSSPATAWGDVGFALYADDYMQNSGNHYGIRLTQLLLDGREVFRADVNGVPHAMNRMVNSWGDYVYFRQHDRWYLKSFVEPGNTLPILQADERRGIVRIDQERDYHLEYVLTDYFGNQTRYPFTIHGAPSQCPTVSPSGPSLPPSGQYLLRWNHTNVISRPGMQLVVPYGYVGTDVALQLQAETTDGLSPAYMFSERSCPLFYEAELSLAPRHDVEDPTKLFIGWKHGNSLCLGGEYKDGWVTARVKDMGGTFRLLYDDQPPVITAKATDGGFLRFGIEDRDTGIRSYKGYIDGQFVLLKPLNKALTEVGCRLSNTPVKKTGARRQLKVVVTDLRDNEATYVTDIIY